MLNFESKIAKKMDISWKRVMKFIPQSSMIQSTCTSFRVHQWAVFVTMPNITFILHLFYSFIKRFNSCFLLLKLKKNMNLAIDIIKNVD